jgi:hypothetical protein
MNPPISNVIPTTPNLQDDEQNDLNIMRADEVTELPSESDQPIVQMDIHNEYHDAVLDAVCLIAL